MLGTTGGCVSGPHWSLLKLNPQKQNGYVDLLREHYPRIEAYFPVYTRLSRPHGARRAREVERPVYPGYLFVMVGDTDLRGPVSLPVRAAWVRFAGVVEAIPDRVIKHLKDMEKAGELVREVRHVNPYVPGARVYVHLPMQNILAVIVRLVGNNRAIVDSPLCRITVPIHRLQVL